jgi:hypothetical protein
MLQSRACLFPQSQETRFQRTVTRPSLANINGLRGQDTGSVDEGYLKHFGFSGCWDKRVTNCFAVEGFNLCSW